MLYIHALEWVQTVGIIGIMIALLWGALTLTLEWFHPKPVTVDILALARLYNARYTESHDCPFCDSDSLDWGSVDVEGKDAFQEVSCSSCGAGWTDAYMYVGYREV